MVKNSLTHEEKVAFHENYLKRSKNWQKYIDLLEERFEIVEITSWKEFFNQFSILGKLFNYFSKIIECDPKTIWFSNFLFQEIYLICEYFSGKKEKDGIMDLVNSLLGKTLFLITWITKLENQDNNTDQLLDHRLITHKNIFQILKTKTLSLYEEDITEYLDSIKIDGISELKDIFVSNINEKLYPAESKFLDDLQEKIVNVNAFNYQSLKTNSFNTWEENYLLDMLNVSFKKDKRLVPLFSYTNSNEELKEKWSLEVLKVIQDYYHCFISDFVIETIRYVLYGNKPTENVINKHIELFLNYYPTATSLYDKYHNSSFSVISFLFKDKLIKTSMFSELMRLFSKISDIEELEILNSHNVILVESQRKILKNYYKTKFQRLDTITSGAEYLQYLSDDKISEFINKEYFNKNAKFFNNIIEEDDRLCSNYFIKYMLFLLRLQNNQNVDKEKVKWEMIRIQSIWENKYFEKCSKQLHTFSQTISIKNEQLDKYNQAILNNPMLLANACMFTKTDQYITHMEIISENAIFSKVSKIHLEKTFPIDETIVFDVDRHDVDRLTGEIIEQIIKEYGYRFLNILDTKVYIRELLRDMRDCVIKYTYFFNETKELYESIQESLKDYYSLIDYSDDITLAHLTQLFPIIEALIHHLGSLYSIFPFKEDESNFMKSKDPSSILKILLEKTYFTIQSFETVSDFLFIYHNLYNGNFFNIRNECVHGRSYTTGDELVFGFKVTLLSLAMLIQRIEEVYSYIEYKYENETISES